MPRRHKPRYWSTPSALTAEEFAEAKRLCGAELGEGVAERGRRCQCLGSRIAEAIHTEAARDTRISKERARAVADAVLRGLMAAGLTVSEPPPPDPAA